MWFIGYACIPDNLGVVNIRLRCVFIKGRRGKRHQGRATTFPLRIDTSNIATAYVFAGMVNKNRR